MKPTFAIGEVVQVLASAWLPKERTLGHGTIERITESSSGEPLYWINGFPCARTANVLRPSGAGHDVPEPAPRVRIIHCADCGCELLRHPDEPVTEPKRCATCWNKGQRYTRHINGSMSDSVDSSPESGEPMTLCIAAECEWEDKPAIAMVCDWRAQTGDISQPHGLIGSEDVYKLREFGPVTVMLAGNHSLANELYLACRPVIREFIDIAPKDPNSFDLVINSFQHKLRMVAAEKKIERVQTFVPMRAGMPFEDFKKLSTSEHADVWNDIRNLNLGADLLIAYVAPPPLNERIVVRLDRWGNVHWETNYGTIGDGSEVARAFLCLQGWEQSGPQTEATHHHVESVPLKECLYRIFEAKQAAHFANPSSVGESSTFQVITASQRISISGAFHRAMEAAFKKKHRVPKLEEDDDKFVNFTQTFS